MREKPIILIVDDDLNFLEIFSTKLNASGFEAQTAMNEAEALQKAKQFLPDLILMDIHMPGATGTDAALAIHQQPETANVRIAFLTSLENPWPAFQGNTKEISSELGMQDFLKKTDDLNILVNQIQEILSRPSIAGTGEAAPTQ